MPLQYQWWLPQPTLGHGVELGYGNIYALWLHSGEWIIVSFEESPGGWMEYYQ